MQAALPIVVLISGNGSNLQAMIDAIHKGLPVKILAVISNKANVYGLERAKQAHIPAIVIPHQDYASPEAFDQELRRVIDRYSPKLIVLAGFMRKLSAEFVHHYAASLINIHPSLLPKYKGLHTHRQVLAAGDQDHGVTVHYVSADIDSGPIICQAKLAVQPNETEASLTARVHELEHVIYPQVLQWIAEKKLSLQGDTVYFEEKALPKTGKLVVVG